MKAIFFDLDGTLVHDNKISEENIAAMNKVQAAGHKLIMNTGRSAAFIPQVAAECVKWDGRICGNSYIEYGGEVLERKVMEREQLAFLYDFCEKKRIPCKFEGEEAIYTMEFDEKKDNVLQYELERYRDVYPWKTMQKEYTEQGEALLVTKMTLCEPIDKKYHNCFPGMYVIDMGHYAEIVCNGYTKATGMELISKKLGIGVEDTVAFGDSMNDTDMLKYAGTSVIMPHSLKMLDEISTFRVTSETDGVAVGLYEIFSELR
ncbi:MAG: HAD family phosphatase [Oscillospiraceae bacterium]|nr:HAD family phosphatase [Oscillospiraceae bacterium]